MKKFLLILSVALGVIYIAAPKEIQKIAVAVAHEVQNVAIGQTKKTASQAKKTVTKEAQQTSQNIMFELTNKAQQTVNRVAQATNSTLEQKTQQVLGVVFQTTGQPSVAVITPIANENVTGAVITTVDFLNDKDKLFKFEKNKKYYIRFKNLPEHYCLFINNNKYELPFDKTFEMTFSTQGTYTMRFDQCAINDKFSDIVVE